MDAKMPMRVSAAASGHTPGASAIRSPEAPMPAKKMIIITRRPQTSPSRPAGRDPRAEHPESAHGIRNQVLPGHAPFRGDGTHRGGEDQEEEVVDGVANIEQ